jgi:hypothetical protein
MRNFLAVVGCLFVATLAVAAAPPPVSDVLFAQFPKSDGLHLGKAASGAANQVQVDGDLSINKTTTAGTCTMNGASPAVCTATVRAGSRCVCAINGTSAAIAAGGCAVSLSSTTLTLTTVNASTQVANYLCF